MNSYKCIIFDCDGVLVDSEELAIRTLIETAKKQGAEINLEYALENFKGTFLGECIRRIEKISGKNLPVDFENHFRQRSFEVFKNELKPVKGIKNVLESLQIPFCTASSGPQDKIKFNLTNTGLIHFFENRIFSCYDIGKWKPDPAIFLHAAEAMGYKPEDCLVIEDSLVGVKAARYGGFDVFGYVSHTEEAGFDEQCTALFYDMDELMPLLHLNSRK
ncbi:MAG: HAD-IA family hydrolase [Pricia sp.]|nr:HAD-IA family hydrolase [Pricia sp.]